MFVGKQKTLTNSPGVGSLLNDNDQRGPDIARARFVKNFGLHLLMALPNQVGRFSPPLAVLRAGS